MLKARDVMTRDVRTIGPDVRLPEAIETLVRNRISGMPVCDAAGRVIGMISEKDMLNFVFSGNIEHTTVAEAMSRSVVSFPSDTPLDKLCLVMGEKQVRRIPIIDDGVLVGVVSRRSIIRTVVALPVLAD